jgi:hypothetical protein
MTQQQEINQVCHMWQCIAAQDGINNDDFDGAIVMLEQAINNIGFDNGARDSLIGDPEYGTFDDSVRDLVSNIERYGFSKHGPVVYAFLIKNIADLHSELGDGNAFTWRTKLLKLLEKHPDIQLP